MVNRSRHIAGTVFAIAFAMCGTAYAQSVNAGDRQASSDHPFDTEAVAQFDTPWALSFLPDGRMLVTEKPGRAFLVTQQGEKRQIDNVPEVLASGQNGLLDIAVSPDFAESRQVYFTYVDTADGGALSLALTTLSIEDDAVAFVDPQVIWRQTPSGGGGQPGGIIAFNPRDQHLFLAVGDRMEPSTAQDPAQARGKVIRLNLDGSVPDDNPMASAGGVQSQTWSTGHRNPYGLAFDTTENLWLHEMGPRGGDELNLIAEGQNYGWPIVSNGNEYSGAEIPDHSTRPEFAAPAVFWNPVIAPAGLEFYDGDMFADWQGSALIGGLAVGSLIRVELQGTAADEVDRWDMGARIRDVDTAPDGAVWIIEDSAQGNLSRLTPN